ncbi:ATP-binding protein [Fusibacter bizertensis]
MKKILDKYKYAMIVIIALIVMIVIIGVSYQNYVKIQNKVIEIEQFQLLSLAETLAKSVENFFTNQQHNLEILSKNRTFVKDYSGFSSDGNQEDLFKNLEDYYNIQSENIELIRLVKIDGTEIYSFPTTDYTNEILTDIQQIELKKLPDVGAIYNDAGKLFLNVYQPIYYKYELTAVLYIKIKVDTVYLNFIAPVKAGEKGYASVKDSDGTLIMHPNSYGIGEDIIEVRMRAYPDFDWSELAALVEKQKNKESGVGIYHSLWFTDNDQLRIKKFSAYAPANIGSDFWIVNISKDYLEVVSFLKNRTYTIVIVNFLLLLVFVTFGLLFYKFTKDKAIIEKERALIIEVKALNEALEYDISKRIKLESELISSKNKFENIFESGSDCIFVVSADRSAQILEVNYKVELSLGYSKEQLLTMSYFDISSRVQMDAYYKLVQDVDIKAGITFEDELHGIDDKVIPVEINARIMNNENQTQIVMISRDITMKRLFDKEMEENKKREALMIYQSRLAAMGEMIGNIAHQWRQPLSGLAMIYNNIIDAYKYDELDEAYLEAQGVRHADLVKFMSSTIDDFRFFFDPKTEKRDFLISSVSDRTLDFLKETIRLNNIEVTVKLENDVLINGLPNQLSQVLFSIIKNAIDAIVQNNTEEKKIFLDISRTDENLTMTILDSGGGVDTNFLPKLFDAYFTTKDEQTGTGLGLYISKVIIEKNFKGNINAANKENGLCITINFPI